MAVTVLVATVVVKMYWLVVMVFIIVRVTVGIMMLVLEFVSVHPLVYLYGQY